MKPENSEMKTIKMEMLYGRKEFQESERYKKLLTKSGDIGKMFVSKLDELGAIVESLEPPWSKSRYNHVRVRVIKDNKTFITWFQARHRDDFSKKYIEPLEDSLEAIIKHNLTPGDYIIVRQPLPLSETKGRYEKSVKTMTEAFDKLLEVIKTA
jgi:hypothetical protein